jgi:hypothetical protein
MEGDYMRLIKQVGCRASTDNVRGG